MHFGSDGWHQVKDKLYKQYSLSIFLLLNKLE